ncbi:MAG: hypothetical protein HYR88_13540 [Verrucomicrobia bacterium]|nr:hypothetical protein [Verrucomicrobiota bacterium]MBI3867024.1 hypothetical protein [Verrucomicrobiota bacterium]
MRDRVLFRCRCVIAFFIAALALSGVTAFPLLHELRILSVALGVEPQAPLPPPGLAYWIHEVRWGLEDMHVHHPWIAYGTDWLAFAHVVLAIFFIGPFRDPVRNRWVLEAGVIACLLVPVLAFVCGPVRGIPFGWRCVDASFGVFGILPLLYSLRLTSELERSAVTA